MDTKEQKIIIHLIVYSVAIAIVILRLFFNTSGLTGRSMEPTITYGATNINQLYVSDIRRGDIVSISTGGLAIDIADKDYITKRVIGIPGDIIIFYKNNLYVNGEIQDEKYIKGPMIDNSNEITLLKDNEFYVLGDNRNRSLDSRNFGPIKNTDIFSKVVKVIK